MKKPVACYPVILLLLAFCACRNEAQIKEHIQTNQVLLQKKQRELSDLNYKVTSNSLHVGTKDYDSTFGKDFYVHAAMLQASIDSLKTQTDSARSADRKIRSKEQSEIVYNIFRQERLNVII